MRQNTSAEHLTSFWDAATVGPGSDRPQKVWECAVSEGNLITPPQTEPGPRSDPLSKPISQFFTTLMPDTHSHFHFLFCEWREVSRLSCVLRLQVRPPAWHLGQATDQCFSSTSVSLSLSLSLSLFLSPYCKNLWKHPQVRTAGKKEICPIIASWALWGRDSLPGPEVRRYYQ